MCLGSRLASLAPGATVRVPLGEQRAGEQRAVLVQSCAGPLEQMDACTGKVPSAGASAGRDSVLSGLDAVPLTDGEVDLDGATTCTSAGEKGEGRREGERPDSPLTPRLPEGSDADQQRNPLQNVGTRAGAIAATSGGDSTRKDWRGVAAAGSRRKSIDRRAARQGKPPRPGTGTGNGAGVSAGARAPPT